MKEAAFTLVALLGAVAGITAGYYLTRSTQQNIASYGAAPASLSTVISLRGVITGVDTAAHTVTVETPSPYGDNTTLFYHLGLDSNTGVDHPQNTTIIQTIADTLLKKPLTIRAEQKKNGTLYLRSVRAPVDAL